MIGRFLRVMSNGSDFASFGTDETTKLRDNTTRERWETHLWMGSGCGAPLLHEQAPDGCDSLK